MDKQPAIAESGSRPVRPTTVGRPALPAAALPNRWTQLVLGVAAMVPISSPQYVWALFTEPLTRGLRRAAWRRRRSPSRS